MTQDEIKEILAKVYGVAWTNKSQLRDLTAFAELVAQHEREACAKSLEDKVEATDNFQAKVFIEWCATHIRARGQA